MVADLAVDWVVESVVQKVAWLAVDWVAESAAGLVVGSVAE